MPTASPSTLPTSSSTPISKSPPQLPMDIEQWSTRALADWLGVSISTIKYHARQAFRSHNGRWEFNREQAQKVVNRIYHFGHLNTLHKGSSSSSRPVTKATQSVTQSTTGKAVEENQL